MRPACQSSCPHPPCPVGREGGAGQGLIVEVTAKPLCLPSQPSQGGRGSISFTGEPEVWSTAQDREEEVEGEEERKEELALPVSHPPTHLPG
jgi:hypothetical protein